jgi:DNA primase
MAMFERLKSNSDMSSPIDKQKLINAMFELIIAVNNLTIQEHYKVLLAEKLGFAPEIINVQFQKYKAGEGKILLRHQERQAELATPPPYQPSRELLFVALFHQEFLVKLFGGQSDAFLQALTDFAMQIAVAVPESVIAKVFKGELSDEEITEINALQLRREKELGEISEPETKKAVLQRVISPSIQDYFKMGSKSPHLSNEEKLALNKLRIMI